MGTDKNQTTAHPHKKLFIKTWGCQMNVYDSARMADILAPLGYQTVDTPDGADFIILNTCHIREKATDKVFSEIGRLKPFKEQAQKKVLMAVSGCVAQAEGEFIMERASCIDMVFGPQTYHQLPEMVMQASGERVVNTDFPTESKFDHLPEDNDNQGPAAFLSVQEGCDKFCTFCVVPYTRGSEYSRPPESVLDEAHKLLERGTREITLLGQNVNAYHGQDSKGHVWNLAKLIEEVAKIDGIERIRYTTSHPRDMDDALIEAHRDIDKLMPYLHLPIQSGSNKILEAMNRKHKASKYIEIIEKLHKARPDIALSSDFIVGFPGETDQDFEDTMQIVKDVTYASAYSFKYSKRPGTPGAALTNQVLEPIKAKRLEKLQTLLNEQQLAFNQKTCGLELPILFERKGQKDGQLQGRTPYNQAINVPANERLLGEIIPVRIETASPNSLTGSVVYSETVVKQA